MFSIKNWFTANFLGYRRVGIDGTDMSLVAETRYTGCVTSRPEGEDTPYMIIEYKMRWRFRVIEWVKGLFNA